MLYLCWASRPTLESAAWEKRQRGVGERERADWGVPAGGHCCSHWALLEDASFAGGG